jgi:hypothetical protein
MQIGDVVWVRSVGIRDGHHFILAKNVRNGVEREVSAARFRAGKEPLCDVADIKELRQKAGLARRGKPNGCATHTWKNVLEVCAQNNIKALNIPAGEGFVFDTTARGVWNFECRCGTVFSTSINNLLFYRTRSCGCVKSFAEGELCAALQDLIPGIAIARNDRTELDGLEMDLWIPSLRVGIEYCGLWWHGEVWNGPDARRKHLLKLQEARARNVRLITIFEDEWVCRKEVVLGYLGAILGVTHRRVGARTLTVAVSAGRDFVAQYHLQGSVGGEVFSLADSEGATLAAAIFARPNASRGSKNKEGVWELARYCVRPGVTVSGGAGKLISAWRRLHPEARSLVSYSDNRWSNGNLYRALGFSQTRENPPSYWYFEKNTAKRVHRFRWRKSVALATFGGAPESTEWDIMKDNGWDRIWDCGSIRWELAITPTAEPARPGTE